MCDGNPGEIDFGSSSSEVACSLAMDGATRTKFCFPPSQPLRLTHMKPRVEICAFPKPRFYHRKPKRGKSWCRYYSNSSALRHLLPQGGDISASPGPVSQSINVRKPKCYVCERTIAYNRRSG